MSSRHLVDSQNFQFFFLFLTSEKVKRMLCILNEPSVKQLPQNIIVRPWNIHKNVDPLGRPSSDNYFHMLRLSVRKSCSISKNKVKKYFKWKCLLFAQLFNWPSASLMTYVL